MTTHPEPAVDDYVPLPLIAYRLRVPYQTLYQHAKAGRLGQLERRAGRWYVSEAAAENYAAGR